MNALKLLSGGGLTALIDMKKTHKNRILGKFLAQKLECNEEDLALLEELGVVKRVEDWHGFSAYEFL